MYKTPHNIAVLLSTYNGASHLQELLGSLEQQTYRTFHLIIRDDGSNDPTTSMLETFVAQTSLHVTLLPHTPNCGVRQSFATLLRYGLEYTQADLFMFCDQDDVWNATKIERILAAAKSTPQLTPLLVHTDLSVVDERLQVIDVSFWHFEHINPDQKSLNRLLMHNTVTGCTMMINRTLAELAMPIPDECIMHDWWIALVASAFGTIVPLKESTMFYRQHGLNDTGAKHYKLGSMPKKIYKIFITDELYIKHLNHNLKQAVAFLERYRDRLEPQHIAMLQAFTTLKSQSWLERRATLIRYRLFKNGLVRNLGLLARI
ncbi:MAG: glycosyltransferase family 2 protein [Campylobacterales bacterium]|nr:glycosyltransferase family 2 protein [Campylobacterales bacterium]